MNQWYSMDPETKLCSPISFDQMLAQGELTVDEVRVADDTIYSADDGLVWVSTVFLRLDHGWSMPGTTYAPLLFETMVFPTAEDDGIDYSREQECHRCSTYLQALDQHRKVCHRLNAGLRLVAQNND